MGDGGVRYTCVELMTEKIGSWPDTRSSFASTAGAERLSGFRGNLPACAYVGWGRASVGTGGGREEGRAGMACKGGQMDRGVEMNGAVKDSLPTSL